MDKKGVSIAVIRRMPRYYRYLSELEKDGIGKISSKELADRMGLTASQVRQDFNCFGGFGQQGYGYNISLLKAKISEILGLDRGYTGVIVGVGHLGHALIMNFNFEERGVKIIAAFDIQKSLIGQSINGVEVFDTAGLESFVKGNNVDIVVLTLPRAAVRETAKNMAEAGVRGIWNFTSVDLGSIKDSTVVENVHFSDSIMTLSYLITK